MKTDKWIKRKFPMQYVDILFRFKKYILDNVKENNMRLGRLPHDLGENKKGDLAFYKRIKEFAEEDSSDGRCLHGGWTGDFEYIYHFQKGTGIHNVTRENLLIQAELKKRGGR